MELQRFHSIQEFWQEAEAFLLLHEAENSWLLGIAYTLLHHGDRYPHVPYLAIAKTNNSILAAAIRTPPHKLLLSKAQNLDALTVVAQDLHQESLPGVAGLVFEVEAFVQIWQNFTGQSARRTVEMRIHELTSVQPVASVKGDLRLATEGDCALLMKWIPAFFCEVAEIDYEPIEQIIESGLKRQSLYLWEDSTPVSLAASKRSEHFTRIGLVYTPPEYRRKGYATACVASLSQKFLDQGCLRCFLLTDLANPTSNYLYRKIGYQPISDWHEYSFISKQ
jgi:uncharacterized protein